MKKIYLHGIAGKDKFIIVDDRDYAFLTKTHLYLNQRGYSEQKIYIKGSGNKNRKTIVNQVHRLLIDAPKGKFVDHINGNKLDNRRSNLRLATKAQNSMNRPAQQNNKSGYKGVSWSKEKHKWKSYIVYCQKQYHLGYYESPIIAARAYDKKAKELFGNFARFNLKGGASL